MMRFIRKLNLALLLGHPVNADKTKYVKFSVTTVQNQIVVP